MAQDPGISITLPGELVETIATRVAAIVLDRTEEAVEPWLDVEGAALYLACPRSRIYDLVAMRRLRVNRDGRRLLFRRAWLDAALEAGPEIEHRSA